MAFLAHDSGHNYAPNTSKLRLKIALVEVTNEFEDEGAASQGGCWGAIFETQKICHNLFSNWNFCLLQTQIMAQTFLDPPPTFLERG